MGRKSSFGTLLWTGGTVLASCTAWGVQAQDCAPLKMAASIQMKPIHGGTAMLVPIMIEGTQRHLLFDTGGYMSQITSVVADQLKLERRQSSLQLFDVSGNKSDQFVIAKQIEIGGMRASNLPFMVINPDSNLGKGDEPYDGILSSDFLFKYDIEVDYGSNKLNYFLPDHCEGKVIYWPHDAVGVVPVTVFDNQIKATVELDGKKIDAIVDTGAYRTTISMATAKYRFGLTPESPGVEREGAINGDETLQAYTYRFSKLSFGDIAAANIKITLLPDKVNSKNRPEFQTEWRAKRVDEDLKLTPMLIGMDLLKRLHIYMAFKERRLYVTPLGPAQKAAAAGESRP
jgi:predicted aspartyl protease